MAIYSGSGLPNPLNPPKFVTGDQMPDRAVDNASWRRAEPLITPERVRSEFLFGIPLVSPIRDPITNRAAVMTDPLIQKFIEKAVTVAERDTTTDILPVQHREKKPFDRAEYEQFGFMKTDHKPVSSIDRLTVTPSNDIDVFEVPTAWVEANYLVQGQINIIPLTVALTNGNVVNTQGGGGAVFLSILGTRPWLPAFWMVQYTSGWMDGKVPIIVNELVGTIAAMNILSQLAAAHAIDTSFSLGMDGASQSVSTPGPQVFAQRLEELKADRDRFTRKIRAFTGQSIVAGNV